MPEGVVGSQWFRGENIQHGKTQVPLVEMVEQERKAMGEIVTGLLYVDPDPVDLHASMKTIDKPLNSLTDAELVPGAKALESINAGLR